MAVKITGVDALKRKMEALSNIKQVSFAELFPPEFMESHTDFSSISDMADASGFKIESAEDFKAIPDDEWDAFISARTQFESWADMQQTAFQQFLQRKMG